MSARNNRTGSDLQLMSTTTRDVSAPARLSRGLAATLDWATASHWRAVALLLGFAALAFLPGFFQIPPVDRDEARFAQATKQMLETGEYVDIHFQDEVRYKKPVGIYWLQAAAVKAGGVLGVSQAAGAMARVAGPIVGTWTMAFGTGMPYLTGAVAMIAACLFAAASVRQPAET
jgi:4-amino-4-deoxy-L-arabinose transferase-like glycosyltransferase